MRGRSDEFYELAFISFESNSVGEALKRKEKIRSDQLGGFLLGSGGHIGQHVAMTAAWWKCINV